MNCRRTRSLLSAYIDSELTGQEMLLIRDHLSWCATCSEERESLLQVKRLLSALPERCPRPSLVFEMQELAGLHPIEATARRFFRSITPIADTPGTAIGSMSVYGRRFAMVGVLSLMSVWFIVAPSASESPQIATAVQTRHSIGAKIRRFASRSESIVLGHGFGQASFGTLAQNAETQDATLSLASTPQDPLRSMPVIGAPPFGQNVFLGGYPSSQPTSLGSFVYTGYSVPSH